MTKVSKQIEEIVEEVTQDDVVATEENVESIAPEKEEVQQIVVDAPQKKTFKDKLVRNAMWVRSNGKRILTYTAGVLLVCLAAGALSKKSEDGSVDEGNGFDDLTLL